MIHNIINFLLLISSGVDDYVIKQINIIGNGRTVKEVILKYIGLKENDVIDIKKLDSKLKIAKENLKNLLFINFIVTKYEIREQKEVVIDIILDEGLCWYIYGGDGFGGFEYNNFDRRTGKYNLELGLKHLKFDVEKRWIRNSNFWSSLDLLYKMKKEKIENTNFDYTQKRISFNPEITYALNYRERFSLGYKMQFIENKTNNIKNELFSKEYLLDKNKINDLYLKYLIDYRDDHYFPKKGIYLQLFYSISKYFLGSEINSDYFFFKGTVYYKIKRCIFSNSLLYGNKWGEIPYYRYYNLKGISGFRGQRNIYLAKNFLLLRNEVKVFLFSLPKILGSQIYSSLFFDWVKTENLVDAFSSSIGVGILWYIPSFGINLGLYYSINTFWEKWIGFDFIEY